MTVCSIIPSRESNPRPPAAIVISLNFVFSRITKCLCLIKAAIAMIISFRIRLVGWMSGLKVLPETYSIEADYH